MNHLAIKYFIRFGQLDIPFVGQLKLSKKEAALKDGVLVAPSEYIEFKQCIGIPTKQFYQYLANALDITTHIAAIHYQQYWTNKFQESKITIIGSLGKFTKNEDTYLWHSDFNSSNYYNNIDTALLPNTEGFEDTPFENPKDKWVIWAIVLTVIAVLAILYKQ